MRVLWITNIPLPPICEWLGWHTPSVGGWMYSSLKRIKDLSTDNQFAVATIYSGKDLIVQDVEGIKYYLLPLKGKSATNYNAHLEILWRFVQEDFNPCITHIHGSEYPHGLAYIQACGSQRVVVSLQGIVSVLARYYHAGINIRSYSGFPTFRDIIKRGGFKAGQRSFEKQGIYEKKLLSSVNHIIGRTEWDKDHSWAINPKAIYHYCGETLRDKFYQTKWSYNGCEPHSIFISQANYPIKGFHKFLECLPFVIREFPDVKVYVAGEDPTLRPWWKITGYGKFLKKQIKKLKLTDYINFTGMLNEEGMLNHFLKANIFVCPSSIENSPNSLGEAQLLGMPHVASFVGGVPEIVNYNPKALYRFEETEMLAKRICEVFSEKNNLQTYEYDTLRYNGDKNTNDLLSIYQSILA